MFRIAQSRLTGRISMIKLQIGVSTFTCDSAEEAVRIHRLVSGAMSSQQATTVTTGHRITPRNGTAGGMTFIKRLGPYVGKELKSDEMAKVAGAKSAAGLGPRMAQLRKTLADDGVMLEDFIIRRKPDAASPVTWTVVKAEA